MIKAPNGDILIDKKITGIENLLELIVDATGLQKGDIRIDESTIREVSEKDRNTAVDVEITKGGHTNRVVAYYNRVSLAEIGNVEAEKNNDAVLNYIDGENGDFSTAFNDKAIKTKLKQIVADRVNIPSDEIVVESIDYSKKYEGYTSVTFKTNGDNAKTIKDNFTVKSWYVPPLYTINDVNLEKKLGTPNDFSTGVTITVKNDRDIVTDSNMHVVNGDRKANNPLFFPKGNITDFESTNYKFGNTDEELVGYLVDWYHTNDIQDSVNNRYEITEVKQLKNGFSKVWVESKNKDVIDRNGYYKIKQFNPKLHTQRVKFVDGTSDSVKYIHGKSYISGESEVDFWGDDGKTYAIGYYGGGGYIIYSKDILYKVFDFVSRDDLRYLDPDGDTPPPDYKMPELTDIQRKKVEEYFKIKKYKPVYAYSGISADIESGGLYSLKYGKVFNTESVKVEYDDYGSRYRVAYGTVKVIQSGSSGTSILDNTNKTYYSHSNYGKLYIINDTDDLVYFAKMSPNASYSDEEIREEKELVEREIFNRYGLPYDKIVIDWDNTIASNFNEIFYSIKQSVSCEKTEVKTIKVYKRTTPNFLGDAAINVDIRYITRQKFKPNVNEDNPNKRVFDELSKDKDGIVDYYYFSKG